MKTAKSSGPLQTPRKFPQEIVAALTQAARRITLSPATRSVMAERHRRCKRLTHSREQRVEPRRLHVERFAPFYPAKLNRAKCVPLFFVLPNDPALPPQRAIDRVVDALLDQREIRCIGG